MDLSSGVPQFFWGLSTSLAFLCLRVREKPMEMGCFLKLAAMAVSTMGAVFGLFVGLVVAGSVSSTKFEELFQPSWAADHHVHEGDVLKLKLDYYSGKKWTLFQVLSSGCSVLTATAQYMDCCGILFAGTD
ncbi:hypothetical protein SAY86_019153 [Trapa natans]|uniref:Uncharacterized protein n=1 Tax=Trapa natans TaxID=22666 RepID=A0AAN7LG79_TRANT|nr:hypothetical protein SAY86_019153 [Trapa natans]